MKCDFCGGTLSLADEKCPACGKINRHARQHIEDMKHYEKEFTETKEDVYGTAKSHSEWMVRLVVIAVLLVLCLAVLFVCATADELYYSMEKSRENMNFTKNSARIEEYLAEENYQALDSFYEVAYMDVYDGPYREYRYILSVVNSYGWVEECMQEMQLGPGYNDYTTPEYYLERLVDALDSFYERCEWEPYDEEVLPEEHVKEAENMKLYLKQTLQSYFNLTSEEAESLESLSSIQRAVLLEESIYGE